MSILEILAFFLTFRKLFCMLPSNSLETLYGQLLLDLSWLLSSSSAQHKLCLPHPFLPLQTIFRCTFKSGRKGSHTVSVHLVDQRFGQLIPWVVWAGVQRKKGSKHQTFWGGRERYLVKEEALHLEEPDITSWAHFTRGFSRQSGFMGIGELLRQKASLCCCSGGA